MANNPFSALIPVETNDMSIGADNTHTDNTFLGLKETKIDLAKMNIMIENIFYITIDKDHDNISIPLVYLEEIAESAAPRKQLDMELMEHALFERLLLPNPSLCVLPKQCKEPDKSIIETDVLIYLFATDINLSMYENSNDKIEIIVIKKIQEIILRNAVTALKQPELFSDQILCDQLFNIIKSHFATCQKFISSIINEFMADDNSDLDQLKTIVIPIMKLIQRDILKANLLSLDLYIFPAISLFIENSYIVQIFLDTCKPTIERGSSSYQNTLLGSLLSLSVLPKFHPENYRHFSTPLENASNNIEEANIWTATDHLITNLHKIFLILLKHSPKTKNDLLNWIGDCLHRNEARGKIWTSEILQSSSLVSDGFMINLSTVLLLLSQPFCTSKGIPKYLKIDPTYCAVEERDRIGKGVHMKELHKETCIIPPREVYEEVLGITRPTVATYNFMTECFYMTHKALDLGYRVIVEKLLKLNQELNQLRQTFADTMNIPNNDLSLMLDSRMKSYMTKLISMRCALQEPQLVSLLINFHIATCNWLVQLAIHKNKSSDTTFAPLTSLELTFPMSDDEPDTLRCVPECFVENIFKFLSITRHFKNASNSDQEADLLEPVLSLVLVFMGSSKKMRNPHLRARLAECLETLLPNHETDELPINSMSSYIRDKLFRGHPHRLQIVPCLLNVFVGIEVTGESVQFEQKFNYRRPMYLVMDYLWTIEEHRECFKRLSEEAEANMEAVSPPIFLRFVNLLMNDAVFLLDEALNNMSQIRTMQNMSETELAQRPQSEREEHYVNLEHVGMIARFDNILGQHTISTLERLTSEIKSVFCHPTMIDRIAAMLNYFLLNLVGPNQKNFKVKDSKEFEFDPVATVLDICRIYIHLGQNKDFCLAVSQDGRSYSPQLFNLAENVLVRINRGGELISSLREIADTVAQLARRQLEDDEALSDAPEEFLDPIMSTIMYDPVVLPSSKISIDRTTIARHVLSDQSDPFNRSPLTMDQVMPNEELKRKIFEWVKSKRMAHTSTNSSKRNEIA